MKHRHSVLVVEDDAAMRDMVVSLLEEEGLVAMSACDGEAALETLRKRRFEAILSDVRMPRKDGLQLLREVIAHWPECKVIIMTAFGSPNDADMAVRAGAFALIAKPFGRSELLGVLGRAFEPNEGGN